jgi:alanine-synthesizing transaminase
MPNEIHQSEKLADVLYDIRGPVLDEAKRLEAAGQRILKLNIGNPHPFGFETPAEILVEVSRSLQASQGYSDHKELLRRVRRLCSTIKTKASTSPILMMCGWAMVSANSFSCR